MATRTETQLTSIGPQARSAQGVNTFVQHYANPKAGQGLSQLSEALGVAYGAAEKRRQDTEAEFENNLDYYASQFAKDREIGLVDATQVGRAHPDASPIVAGKITEIIGKQWATTYTRSRLDEFLADDQLRLDPEARKAFIAGIREEVSRQVEGRPFFGNGAVTGAESIIREYEGSLQRESAGYHRQLQEEDFQSSVSSGLLFQPATEAAGDAAGILDFVAGPESGGNYNAYYENSGNRSVQFTSMTVDEVIAWQRNHIAKGNESSAVGRYQIILDTMRGLKSSMGLSGSEIFSPELQDKMAVALLENRGYSDFKAGKISKEEFANNLAQEWAGLPMVSGAKAGKSAYAGDGLNAAGVGVDAFLSALDNPSQRVSPIDVVDQAAGTTTSINPIRRRELVVNTAIDLALSERDTSILERIPANMRGMPEVEAKIAQAQERVRDLQWQDYTRQQQLQEQSRKEAIRTAKEDILAQIAGGSSIDPRDYVEAGSEVYDYALQVQNDEFTDPSISAYNADQLRAEVMDNASGGAPMTREQASAMILARPNILAADRRRIMDELPQLLDGMNLITNPTVTSFYSSRIGTDVQAYVQSLEGSLGRLEGVNVAGAIRRTFDDTVRTYVQAAIEDGNGVPRGSALVEILERAEEKALRKLEGLQRSASGSEPQAQPQASSGNGEVPDDIENILNKY